VEVPAFLENALELPTGGTMLLDSPSLVTKNQPSDCSSFAGDSMQPTSVEEVLLSCASRVYSVARRMLGQDADAEDVTQEVLIQVIRKVDTFRGEASLTTWLHRVTVNAALQHRRKQSRRREQQEPTAVRTTGGNPLMGIADSERTPAEQMMDRELQRLLEQAIAGLPVIYRDVYVLTEVEGFPYAEVGELLGLGVPAVKTRLHRARLLMRETMAPFFDERG
jgi:RNA polymerase sigma-70 factor, ECF subfamily